MSELKKAVDEMLNILRSDEMEFQLKLKTKTSLFQYVEATDEEISNFENRFNLKLPLFLKDFYKYFNSINTNFMFTQFIGISNIIKDYEEFDSVKLLIDSKFIPIASENGDYMCINCELTENILYHYSHEEDTINLTFTSLEEYIKELIEIKKNRKRN